MKVNWQSPEFYTRHNDTIVPALATGLRSGVLSLMMGSGVSKPLHLPTWPELVVSCCNRAPTAVNSTGIERNTSGENLLLRMQTVRQAYSGDDAKYLESVHAALYEGWMHPSIAEAPEMMRAIGVLVMGSVRGRIKTVVNFNFDSLLEWYLAFHGYVIQVIEQVPRSLFDADVHIFHPHGYLPFAPEFGRRSSMILFDASEQERRVLDQTNPWNDVFRFVLGTNIFLAIGLSGRDPMVRLMLAAADRQRPPGSSIPLGFWFVKRGSLEDDYINNLRSKGVVLVETDTYEEMATMLFEVGRRASGPIIM